MTCHAEETDSLLNHNTRMSVWDEKVESVEDSNTRHARNGAVISGEEGDIERRGRRRCRRYSDISCIITRYYAYSVAESSSPVVCFAEYAYIRPSQIGWLSGKFGGLMDDEASGFKARNIVTIPPWIFIDPMFLAPRTKLVLQMRKS